MRLHRIRLTDYRGVADADIVLDPHGVTIVEGPNEVGKSSIAEAIGLIRGFHDNSKAKEVLAVKPVGTDAGPQVEIEVSTGGYHFTYRKRFLKKPATVLTVSSPRPEQRTGREADDRVEAILAETLDPQLWDALQMVQGESFQQPVLARIEPLRSALATTAAPDAGEGHAGLLDLVESEYLRYFTPMGRPRGEYAALRSRLLILDEQLDGLETEHRRVGECLDRFERNAARLLELVGEEVTSADAVRELRSERDQLSGLQTRLSEERTALEHAEQRLSGHRHEHDERQHLVSSTTDRGHDLEGATAELEQLEAAVALVDAEADRSRRRFEAAAVVARERRFAHRDALSALGDTRLAAELVGVQRQLERAERVCAQAAEHEAFLAASAVDDDAVDALVGAESALAAACSAQDAALAHVSVVRTGRAQVTVAGRPLTDRVHQAVADDVEIVVAGAVTVRVTPGYQRIELAAAVQVAANHRDQLLALHGVADLAEARRLARQRRRHQAQLGETRSAVREVLGTDTLEALRSRRDALGQRVHAGAGPSDAVALGDLEHAVLVAATGCDDAEAAYEQATETARAAEAAASRARDEVVALRHRVAHAETDLSRLHDDLVRSRTHRSDEELVGALGDTRAEVERRVAAVAGCLDQLSQTRADALEQLLGDAEAVVARQARDRRELENDQQRIIGRLAVAEARGLHDRRDELLAEREDAALAHAATDARATAARLLHETMQRHLQESQTRYVAPFKQAVERLGRTVFGPGFQVQISPDLAIESRTLDGVTVPFGSLSGGAREQLAVLGRLACAQLVSADEGAPVVLDDSLGFADPARLTRLATVLRDVGRTAQIIVLTCQPARFGAIGGATVVRLPLEQAIAS